MVVLNNIAVSILVHGCELPEYGDPTSRASNVALRYIERVPGAWFFVKVTALQPLDSGYEPGLDLPFLAVGLYIDGDFAGYRVLDNATRSATFTSAMFDVRGYKIETPIGFAEDAPWNEAFQEQEQEEEEEEEEEELLGEIAVKVYRIVNHPVSVETPQQEVVSQLAVQPIDQPMLDAILELHENPFMNLSFGPTYRVVQSPTFHFQSCDAESPFAIFRFKHASRRVLGGARRFPCPPNSSTLYLPPGLSFEETLKYLRAGHKKKGWEEAVLDSPSPVELPDESLSQSVREYSRLDVNSQPSSDENGSFGSDKATAPNSPTDYNFGLPTDYSFGSPTRTASDLPIDNGFESRTIDQTDLATGVASGLPMNTGLVSPPNTDPGLPIDSDSGSDTDPGPAPSPGREQKNLKRKRSRSSVSPIRYRAFDHASQACDFAED